MHEQYSIMENVVKSPNDLKDYRVIQLDNGLTALLISDCQSQVVSSSDPNRSAVNGEQEPLVDVPNEGPVLSHEIGIDARNNGHTDDCVVDSCVKFNTDVSCNSNNDDSIVMTDDGDSSWTDVSASDSDDSVSDDGDSSEYSHDSSDNNGTGFVGKFRGQRLKRSHSRVKDCSSEKLSAAGLCIGVGSFSDPVEIPGLAHFLEHMVFMGSEKYPNDNDFDNYLSLHGGSSNAYTECEQTIFHFDVQKEYFYGALDRFAQFFIKPLLKKDSIDREIEAVDSEFMLSMPSDTYRVEQLLGSLANDDHPMSKFMWGNVETLKRRPSSRRIDIYKYLKSFCKQHYLPQYMTLAVQSQDSLDQLELWVREIFSAVPASVQSRTAFDHLPPPFENKSFNKIYKVVPVKTINQVIMNWALPSQLKNYRVKPLRYLGWLIGHEGKGSLAAHLKRRNWAVSIESGNSEAGLEHNTTCSCFSVVITLSDEGLQQINQVITAVFEYIGMLQKSGPLVEIYNEIKKVEEIDFRFQEPVDPQDYVEELCLNMQLYQTEHFLTGSQLLMEYNEKVIDDCTKALTADRVNITILSNQFAKSRYCRKKEKWFKTPYRVEDIPDEWLHKWLAPDVNPELSLPMKNPYIAEDFGLKSEEAPFTKYPFVITDSSVSKLWYKRDSTFKVPRAYLSFYLMSGLANNSALGMCIIELFVKLLIHNLSEVVYDAELAQITYDIKVYDDGILLKFGGFNDKLPQLFRTVIDHIAQFSVNEKQFEVVKRDLETEYLNQMMKPEKINNEIRLSLLQHIHWTMLQKQAELINVDLNVLVQLVKEFFSSVQVEGLVQGNITPEEAKELEQYLLTALNVQSSPMSTDARITVSQLPADKVVVFRTKGRNTTDSNCVITNYYQHGPANVHEYIMMELLTTFMEEPCFDCLRTRKQLGYDVGSEIRVTRGILGYTITICSQSSKYSMKHLDDQIETFVCDLQKRVEKLSTQRFRKLVSSLTKMKCIDDNSLSDEFERNWAEILDQTYMFDRRQHEIEALKTVTIEGFKVWSASHLLPSDSRKKLSIQVVGHKTSQSVKSRGVTMTSGCKKMTVRRRGGSGGSARRAVDDASDETQHQLCSDNSVLYVNDIDDFRQKFSCYPPSKITL